MKKAPLILLGIFTAGIGNAASVTWNAFFDTGIINAGSATTAPALALGNWIQIGYFDSSLGATQTAINAAVTADATTVSGTATLAAAFHTFGSLQISPYTGTNSANSGLGGANAGGFQQTTNNFLYGSNPSFAPGSQIYIWALNSTNNTSLATAEATVTQQAIAYVPLSITHPTNASQPWQFPGSDAGGAVTIDITSLQTSGSVFLAGSFITNANNTNLYAAGFASTNNALQLATVAGVPPVPEASTFTVGLLAALAASGIRTRRRA